MVTYDGKGYDYYWTSVDDAGEGVKNIIRIDKLEENHIESDLKASDITTLRGIDGRDETIVISKANGCQKEGANDATSQVNGETGEVERRAFVIIKRTANKAGQLASVGDDIYIFKGGNPNNYVRFNGETWRVLGIYGDRVKIMRSTSIPDPSYKNSSGASSAWLESAVRTKLNDTFYNTLSDDLKAMIDDGLWYTGTCAAASTALEAYQCAKTLTDNAKVGLISSYEFLYASAGAGCTSVSGKSGSFDTMCGLRANDWLTGSNLWTLNPNGSTSVLYIHSSGMVHSNSMATFSSKPIVYLKSQVEIKSGSGTSASPYQFELNNE